MKNFLKKRLQPKHLISKKNLRNASAEGKSRATSNLDPKLSTVFDSITKNKKVIKNVESKEKTDSDPHKDIRDRLCFASYESVTTQSAFTWDVGLKERNQYKISGGPFKLTDNEFLLKDEGHYF